jgi:hypothetical protein
MKTGMRNFLSEDVEIELHTQEETLARIVHD